MTQYENEEYLTLEEVAAIIGRSRRTVERYTKDGKIKRYRRGFSVLYKRSDAERLNKELNDIREDEPRNEE